MELSLVLPLIETRSLAWHQRRWHDHAINPDFFIRVPGRSVESHPPLSDFFPVYYHLPWRRRNDRIKNKYSIYLVFRLVITVWSVYHSLRKRQLGPLPKITHDKLLISVVLCGQVCFGGSFVVFPMFSGWNWIWGKAEQRWGRPQFAGRATRLLGRRNFQGET